MRFDSRTVEPATGFTPVPKGKYQLKILKCQECENANRNGFYLRVECEIVARTDDTANPGQYRGRKLWAQMTTRHETSDQAVDIGLGQISAMSRSVGREVWNHEGELIGGIGEAYVGVEKDDPTRNRITGWVVPDESKDARAPTYNRHRQQQGFDANDAARRGGELRQVTRGGAASVPQNRNPQPPPPRGDDPGYLDDDVPF